MSKENPQVIDKRRFADRINDEDVIDQIRRADPEARPIIFESTSTGEEREHDDNAVQFRGIGRPESFSPSSTPSDKPGMDFPTAIKQVMKGYRVTRLEWENPEIWLMMFYWGQINAEVPAGKYLSIHKANGTVHPLYIADGDMLGDDWVVVV